MDSAPAPGPLSETDLALLRAARAWGGANAPGLWQWFPAARRASLRWGWDAGLTGDPARALDDLRRGHAAQARPDLARVHSSWWVRALREEPLSVRRAVAAHLPAALGESLLEGLGLTPDDLAPDRPAHPGVPALAASLWAVRLVGDLPERDDDPPVVTALTRFDAPTVARLIQTTGLAKWSIAGRPLPELDDRDRARVGPLRARLAGLDPRFLLIAARDVDALGRSAPRAVAHAGMTTFARLLAAADPYRVRWALQHVPYRTAGSLRTLMGTGGRKTPMMARWETEVLRASWSVLHDEGRVPVPWGGPP